MERKEIFEKLNVIFEDVLDLWRDVMRDRPEHIQLIVAIEKAFKLKFTSLEIMKWKNVGEMVDTIQERIN